MTIQGTFPPGNYNAVIRRRILFTNANHRHGCPRVAAAFTLS